MGNNFAKKRETCILNFVVIVKSIVIIILLFLSIYISEREFHVFFKILINFEFSTSFSPQINDIICQVKNLSYTKSYMYTHV